MMPSKKAAACNDSVITELHRNDVLLGRGSGPNLYYGNLQFRDLVAEKRASYLRASVDGKRQMAQDIVDQIRAKGGRFLRRKEQKKKGGNSNRNVEWYAVSNAIALEKTKQALREKVPPLAETDSCAEKEASEKSASLKRGAESQERMVSPPQVVSSSSGATEQSHQMQQAGLAALSPQAEPIVSSDVFSSLLPSILAGGSLTPAAPVDARLLLFQRLALQQETRLTQPVPTNPLIPPLQSTQTSLVPTNLLLPPSLLMPNQRLPYPYALTTVPEAYTSTDRAQLEQGVLYRELQRPTNVAAAAANVDTLLHSQFRDAFQLHSASATPEPQQVDRVNIRNTIATTVSPVEEKIEEVKEDTKTSKEDEGNEDTKTDKEDDVAAFLLSSLAVTHRPRFTAEEVASERQSLSDEEKASILADAFGSYCSLGAGHQNKKARKDLDGAAIAFLVRLMRAELENIPPKDKSALIEAQTKARPEEFSDARLEKFLRVEGMNTKLAAQRFARYWEGRKEVFGPVKYLMRMTLSEALRDDLCALEAGMCCVLPDSDLSGRQMIYIEPRRHTREGYSSDSMMRAIWYVFEVAAQENTHIGGGIIQVSWVKNATIWDYDLKVFDRWAYFQSQAWPIRVICGHVCCTPYIIAKVVSPIINTFSDTSTRTRTIMHDAPEKDVLSVLAKYGIPSSVLPVSMGGQVELNQAEWIAHRHAAELEEI